MIFLIWKKFMFKADWMFGQTDSLMDTHSQVLTYLVDIIVEDRYELSCVLHLQYISKASEEFIGIEKLLSW